MKRKVKRVIDGDTFQTHTKVNGSNFVRIAGKHSPEMHQFGGLKAKEEMRKQIQGKVVTLQPVGRSYGRVVAKVRHKRRLLK